MSTEMRFVRTLVCSAALAALLVCTAQPAMATYDPKHGRWLQRDPIGIQATNPHIGTQQDHAGDGTSLHQYTRSNPLFWSDPSGLISGIASRPAESGSGKRWVGTGVKVCKGYVKGDPIWDRMSAHTYLLLDGTGYGLYSYVHLHGGCSLKTLWDDGEILAGDQEVYPPGSQTGAASGKNYALCFELMVEVHCCKCDPAKIKRAIADPIRDALDAQKKGKRESYSAVLYNCGDWAYGLVSTGVNLGCEHQNGVGGDSTWERCARLGG